MTGQQSLSVSREACVESLGALGGGCGAQGGM